MKMFKQHGLLNQSKTHYEKDKRKGERVWMWLHWQILLNNQEKIMPILHKVFKKIQEEETLLSLFCEVRIILPKPKISHEKKSIRNISFEHNIEMCNKILANLI